jgi:murein L,D-transpeptidase YafK
MKVRIFRHTIVGMVLFSFLWAGEVSGDEGVPVSLIGIRDGMYAVCVDKSLQRLYVYNGRKQVKTIPCSTGMNPGDKKIQGDRRTPEGIYFFEKIIEGQNLPDMYGWRAYTLNYPNSVDRALGKNGNGIWIHGRAVPLEARDTKGCVSLNNNDLKVLDPFLTPYHTPIITLESVVTIDEKSLDAMDALYRDFIDDWINSWQDKDIERYRTYYSTRFYDPLRNQKLEDYLQQKETTFGRYDFISISTHALSIVGTDNYVLCYFLMDFSGDYFQSSGVKYVYLENGSEGPKILAEEFTPLQKAPQWLATAEEMKGQQNASVLAFLDTWRGSWEKKDLDSMKNLYLASFPDRENFFAAKQKNLTPYQSVKVVLDEVDIQRNGVYWTITAKQRFTSDSYGDFGKKMLMLVSTSQGFRVIQESWEKLDENS